MVYPLCIALSPTHRRWAILVFMTQSDYTQHAISRIINERKTEYCLFAFCTKYRIRALLPFVSNGVTTEICVEKRKRKTHAGAMRLYNRLKLVPMCAWVRVYASSNRMKWHNELMQVEKKKVERTKEHKYVYTMHVIQSESVPNGNYTFTHVANTHTYCAEIITTLTVGRSIWLLCGNRTKSKLKL